MLFQFIDLHFYAIGIRLGLKEQISDANFKLSELYERAGSPGPSLQYYKDYVAYRDSVNNIKSVQKMADLRTDFEVSQKQTEEDLLNQEKRNQRIMVISLFIILSLTTVILGIPFLQIDIAHGDEINADEGAAMNYATRSLRLAQQYGQL